MSADLHIIAFNPARVAIDIVREYAGPSALDQEPYDPDTFDAEAFWAQNERDSEISDLLYGGLDERHEGSGWVSPLLGATWIGQVSWLKAGMDGEVGRYIPRVVARVQHLYNRAGGVIQVTDELIPQITLAFNLPHTSMYEQPQLNRHGRWERSRGIGSARAVKRWLQANRGAHTFVGSW